jgi:hypothetical protein
VRGYITRFSASSLFAQKLLSLLPLIDLNRKPRFQGAPHSDKMVALPTVVLATASLLVSLTAAHPGECYSHVYMKREIIARDNAASVGARSLAASSNSAAAQAFEARSIKRRAEVVKNLHQKRGIAAREFPVSKIPWKKRRWQEDV